MKIKPNSIKKSIIEWVFNRKTIKYSIYLSFGFFLSQFSNIMVYYLQGSSNVDTLFSLTNTLNRLPMFYASILSVSLCIFIFLIFQLIFPSLIQRSANKLLRNGLIIGLFFIFISQLLFTSIMRLVYEFSFYIIVISSLLIQKLWIKQPRPNEKSRFDEIKFHYNEIWDLLKVSIPIFVAFIALAIGFDLITKFFSGEIIGLQLQINRHIIMTLYGTIGAIFFIFYPLVKKMIYLKELMLKKQFVDKA